MTTLYFLVGTVFVVGRVVWLMSMYEARAHRQMIAGIQRYYETRSRALVGSDVVPDSSVPQAASGATQGTGGEPPARAAVEAPPVPSRSWWAYGPHPAPTRTSNSVGGGCHPASPPAEPTPR